MAKGVEITLYDENLNPITNTSGITAAWYDITNINYLGAPLGLARNLSTDSDGKLKLDLSLCSGRSIGEDGYLILRKEDATDHRNSLCFQGRVTLSDVTNGQKVWFNSPWQRPAEWPALDDPEPGTQRVQCLVAVSEMDVTPVRLQFNNAYTVDWGDGSPPENFASGAYANHTYDPNNTNLVDTPYGYKCAVIEITPQPGNNLTSIILNSLIDNKWRNPILDVVINAPNATTFGLNNMYSIDRVVIGEWGNVTTMDNMFAYNYNLKHVEIRGNCSNVTSLNRCFYYCTSLLKAPVLSGIDSAPLTTLLEAFAYCYALKSIPAYTFSSTALTTAQNMFAYCHALNTIPGLSFIQTSSSFGVVGLFRYNYALKYIGTLDLRTATGSDYLIQDCRSLHTIENLKVNPSYPPLIANFKYLQYIGFTQAPSVSFSVQGNRLGANALNVIFTALPTSPGKTIYIMDNPGISQPGYDPSIATSKGWIVTA